MTPLVTTEWLAAELGANDLRIVDATLLMADSGRNARAEFEAGHIPRAVFLDLDELADTANPLPNMLPAPEKFASRMQAIGLGDGSRIVVYDNSPLHSAARAWWMLTVFGAHEVAILDGGLAKWQAEGRAMESGKPVVRHRHFTVWAELEAGPHLRADDRQSAHRRPSRSSTPARPAASPAPSPSRTPACAAATSRARRTCRRPSCSTPTARGRRAPTCRRRSRPPASTSTSRSSPPAAAASPRRWSLSARRCSGRRTSRCTTAAGSEWGASATAPVVTGAA